MKKILCLILSVFIAFSAFGQIKNVDEYRARKIDFYCEKDFDKVVNMIGNELSLLQQNKSSYSEELFITLENMLYVDQLFFSLEHNELPESKKAHFKEIFLAQEKKSEDFMGKRDYEEMSSNFLLSVGDIKCQMPFVISIPASIPKLTKAKSFYDNAVVNDPKNCAALISQSLWYMHSPGISGGSKKKSYKIIQEAEKTVRIPSDRFFVLIFKGQIEESLKKIDQCKITLKTAHNLYPNETFTAIVAENLNLDLDFLK